MHAITSLALAATIVDIAVNALSRPHSVSEFLAVSNSSQLSSGVPCVFGTDSFQDAPVFWEPPVSSPIPAPGHVWLHPQVIKHMQAQTARPNLVASGDAFSTPDGWKKFETNAEFIGAGTRASLLPSAAVDKDGRILERTTCKFWRQGGCAIFDYSKEFHVSHETPHYVSAVTLAELWGSLVWHFPMEGVTGLANLNPAVLQDASVKIHVTAKTSYVLDWLNVVGVSSERVVEGVITADNLYVPELGRCGTPSSAQLGWLRDKIHGKIGACKERSSIVLIKRGWRGFSNNVEVHNFVAQLAWLNGLRLELHDDSALPSLEEQLKRFQRAVIVVAPHGAGQLFSVASQPGTCIVEAQQTEDPALGSDVFSRLALRLGQTYSAVPLTGPYTSRSPKFEGELHVSLDDLRNGLVRCTGLNGGPVVVPH